MLHYIYASYAYTRRVPQRFKWYPSSKRCFDCGHILDSLTLDIRHWVCPECGVQHDRDLNAAKNILASGLGVFASGERIRPGRTRHRSLKEELS